MQKQKKKSRHSLYILHKNQVKMDRDLNVKCETIKPLEDNTGENLAGLGRSVTTPKAGSMKEITDKLDLIKIKNLCPVKDKVKRMGENTCKSTSQRIVVQSTQKTLHTQQ